MPIQNVNNMTAPTGTPGRTPSKEIGKDQFLKLLAGQLRHQDPSNAGGGEEFMAQMTQFAMLEQIQNMAAAQQQATASASSTQAVSLIGKTVTYQGADGAVQQGVVEKVLLEGGTPRLSITGAERPLGLGDVQEVK